MPQSDYFQYHTNLFIQINIFLIFFFIQWIKIATFHILIIYDFFYEKKYKAFATIKVHQKIKYSPLGQVNESKKTYEKIIFEWLFTTYNLYLIVNMIKKLGKIVKETKCSVSL